jgi:mRNA interferase MazF
MARDSRIVPAIGDIFLVQLYGDEHVQAGFRPAVVFQNNVGNRRSPNVVILPITSSIKREELPTHVILHKDEVNLKQDSVVLCENPITVSQRSLKRLITKLPDNVMKQIAYASVLASAVICFLDEEELLEARLAAIKLNAIKIER